MANKKNGQLPVHVCVRMGEMNSKKLTEFLQRLLKFKLFFLFINSVLLFLFPYSRLKARAMAMTRAPLFRGVNEKRLDVISQSAAPLLIPSQIPSRSLSTLAISQINQFALRFAALPRSAQQKLEHDMDIALIYHVPHPISSFP